MNREKDLRAVDEWSFLADDLKLYLDTHPGDAHALAALKNGVMPDATITDMALGMVGGCLGEVSALALLAGGLYLLSRKVITLHTPVAYLATVALSSFLFPHGNGRQLARGHFPVGDGVDQLLFRALGVFGLEGRSCPGSSRLPRPSTGPPPR